MLSTFQQHKEKLIPHHNGIPERKKEFRSSNSQSYNTGLILRIKHATTPTSMYFLCSGRKKGKPIQTERELFVRFVVKDLLRAVVHGTHTPVLLL